MAQQRNPDLPYGTWMREIARLGTERWGQRYGGFRSEEQGENWWALGLTPEQVIQEVAERFGYPAKG
jgi:hypothetical protein